MKRWSVLGLLLAGCSSPLTPSALAPSFGEAFAGLYAVQQAALGRTDVDADALAPRTTCRRTGASETGPGEDWTCSVTYLDGVTSGTQLFEVQVKPDGCWKAEGPPSVQPAQIADALTGEPFTNPLAEFDGCFDTSWGA